MSTLSIDVVGTPAPQGSKKGFYNKNLGRVQMVESSKKVAPWRQDVVAATLNRIAETSWEVPTTSVMVSISFRLPRPRYHFRSGKNAHLLRENAPRWVDKKPDIDKLARATLDALTTAAAVKDDAQVAVLCLEKSYADHGEPTGAHIQINHLHGVSAQASVTALRLALDDAGIDSVAAAAVPQTPAAATVPTEEQGVLL